MLHRKPVSTLEKYERQDFERRHGSRQLSLIFYDRGQDIKVVLSPIGWTIIISMILLIFFLFFLMLRGDFSHNREIELLDMKYKHIENMAKISAQVDIEKNYADFEIRKDAQRIDANDGWGKTLVVIGIVGVLIGVLFAAPNFFVPMVILFILGFAWFGVF